MKLTRVDHDLRHQRINMMLMWSDRIREFLSDNATMGGAAMDKGALL